MENPVLMAGFGISLMVCDRHPYEIRCPRNREPLPLPGLLPGSAVSGCLPAIRIKSIAPPQAAASAFTVSPFTGTPRIRTPPDAESFFR
ncbi:MAG: hypothetical protein ACLR0U_14995 [Enterocloster clostridioformis]